MQVQWVAIGGGRKGKYVYLFVIYYLIIYYVMSISYRKECGPPWSDSDGDDDTNLEIPKLSKMLSAINVCRCYISLECCGGKVLNSLTILQNEVM